MADDTSSDSDVDIPEAPDKRRKLVGAALKVLKSTVKETHDSQPTPVVSFGPDYWQDVVKSNPPETPPDAGLPKSLLRKVLSDQYVDYRDLARTDGSRVKGEDYKISIMDWVTAHTKYTLLRASSDPAMAWKLAGYHALIFDQAKQGWVYAATYDRLFRETRFAESVPPEDRDRRFSWMALHYPTSAAASNMARQGDGRGRNEKAGGGDRFFRPSGSGGARGSNRDGRGVCFIFRNQGSCRFGDRCQYTHSSPSEGKPGKGVAAGTPEKSA